MRYTVSDWPVHPMEPLSRPDAFDSKDTLFQVKWDGVRVLAYVYPNGGIRLFNRRLNERTQQYPELISAVSNIPAGTVLDGEVVALDKAGKPDFPRVLRRDLIRSQVKIGQAAMAVPVHYMVFDVLWFNGKEICTLPLTQRLEILDGLEFDSRLVIKVESIPEKGRALFDAVHSEGLEGIVAKKKDSVYQIGQKTGLWQKIKCFRTQTAVVGGYLQDDPARIKSLLLGLPEEDGLRYIGTAGSGLTQRQLHALKEIFAQIPGPCPFLNSPAQAGAKWVLPTIKVQTRFLEYTPQGVMRAPSITGFPEELK